MVKGRACAMAESAKGGLPILPPSKRCISGVRVGFTVKLAQAAHGADDVPGKYGAEIVLDLETCLQQDARVGCSVDGLKFKFGLSFFLSQGWEGELAYFEVQGSGRFFMHSIQKVPRFLESMREDGSNSSGQL